MAPGADKHDATYYFKCMIGGALACGLTHTAICPLDIIKCRMQVNPGLYKSIGDAFTTIRTTEGAKGLTLGFAPTLIGYSLQGLGKFGFYELFKDVYAGIVGQENAAKYKGIGWALSSASAEVIADVLLCPWEAIKVRVQTSKPGTFPTGLGEALAKIKADEGINGLYKGLAPLWARQIPYTVMKFVAFEKTVQFFYTNVFTRPKNEYSKSTQLSVTFASGYIAGVLCALVSQPADTMVSKLNSMKTGGSTGENVKKIYSEIGFNGLWRGMGARIIMIGTLTGLQWWIYDSFKTLVGLQTTGGAVAPAPAAK
jgi:solute carrier family 25 phosphate transporter 3